MTSFSRAIGRCCEALSEHYRLGVVSNFYGNLEAVCQSSGLAPLFAVMTDSHCIGAEKPDPAIFRAALEALGAAPRRPCSWAIPPPRLRGARRAGMGFIWIAPKTSRPLEPAWTRAACSRCRDRAAAICSIS